MAHMCPHVSRDSSNGPSSMPPARNQRGANTSLGWLLVGCTAPGLVGLQRLLWCPTCDCRGGHRVSSHESSSCEGAPATCDTNRDVPRDPPGTSHTVWRKGRPCGWTQWAS